MNKNLRGEEGDNNEEEIAEFIQDRFDKDIPTSNINENDHYQFMLLIAMFHKKYLIQITFKGSINDGVTDYVFRCITGPFAGNFIYLNLTEDGELIGSDPQADYTLFIENAGLSGQHVKINYTLEDNQYGYIIKDLNSEKAILDIQVFQELIELKQAVILKSFIKYLWLIIGTWIKTKPGHQIQIEDEQIFRIEDQTFQFRLVGKISIKIAKTNNLFQKEDENFDVVVEWLARIELKWVTTKLKSYNIRTMKDLKQLQPNIIDEIIDDEDEKARFKEAFGTIDDDFPVDGKQKALLIYSITQDEVLAKVKWSGALITRNGEQGEISGVDKYGVDCNSKFEMLIQYAQNKYFFQVNPKCPGQIYLKLYGTYRLFPDDIVNIGNLDFLVQRFNTGMWCDKGTRITMEDRSVVSQCIIFSGYFSISYFAVFDGHGGDQCAQFLYDQLGERVKDEFMYSDIQLYEIDRFYEYIHDKLVFIITDIDQQFWQHRMNDQDINQDSGSAGVIIFIFGTKIVSVNVGDCRAVLSRSGRPIALTEDHKPYLEKEKQRIMRAGGTVDGNRVNKKLAVSRAFGDFSFKKETTGEMDIVTCDPDIRVWDIDFMVDEFIVLGCDGLFDIFSNQEVVEYVRERLTENAIGEQDPQKVARQICLEAVEISKSQKRGSDNCSVIIVLLSRGISCLDKTILK